MEKVDFKKVAKFVRFSILANGLDTPSEFENLPVDAKLLVYTDAWQLIMDTCNYLSSALSIDELSRLYSKDLEK